MTKPPYWAKTLDGRAVLVTPTMATDKAFMRLMFGTETPEPHDPNGDSDNR